MLRTRSVNIDGTKSSWIPGLSVLANQYAVSASSVPGYWSGQRWIVSQWRSMGIPPSCCIPRSFGVHCAGGLGRLHDRSEGQTGMFTAACTCCCEGSSGTFNGKDRKYPSSRTRTCKGSWRTGEAGNLRGLVRRTHARRIRSDMVRRIYRSWTMRRRRIPLQRGAVDSAQNRGSKTRAWSRPGIRTGLHRILCTV